MHQNGRAPQFTAVVLDVQPFIRCSAVPDHQPFLISWQRDDHHKTTRHSSDTRPAGGTDLKEGIPESGLTHSHSSPEVCADPPSPHLPIARSPPLPLQSGILTDGLDEAFVWTLHHHKGQARVWRGAELFSRDLPERMGQLRGRNYGTKG